MLDIAEAQPAIRFFHGDAVQTKITHLLPQLARKPVLAIHFLRQRHDLLLGKAPGGVANLVGHFAELEIKLGGSNHCRSFAYLVIV